MSGISPEPLAGRVALVTGGASGIGAAIARELTLRGATVAITDIDADALAAAGDDLIKLRADNRSVADIAAAGGRRISIGAALARAAWAAFIEATRLIAEEGSFKGFADNGPSAPLNSFFTDDLKARS